MWPREPFLARDLLPGAQKCPTCEVWRRLRAATKLDFGGFDALSRRVHLCDLVISVKGIGVGSEVSSG